MVKLIGICIILIGCTGTGYSIVKERTQILQHCAQWERILSIMENEIAFQKATMYEICMRISKHASVQENYKKYFLRIATEMEKNEGQTLAEVWKRELQMHFAEIRLPSNIRDELCQLGEKLCFEDSKLQRKIIRETEEELQNYRTNQQQEDTKRNKVTLCMGVMAGLLIIILIF